MVIKSSIICKGFTIIIIATILAIIHISVINRIEKSLVQVIYGPQHWTKRPTLKCPDRYKYLKTKCYGMSSGHAESYTIFFVMLYLLNIIPLSWAIVGVIIICLQRVIWRRHTILQVIIGSLIGLVYVCFYYNSAKIHILLPLLICALLVLFISIITVLLISHKQINIEFPVWVDKSIYPLIHKKQTDTSIFSKVLFYVGHVLIDSDYGYISWSELERILDEMINSLDFKPDIVIGIKTGGAILAGYVAQKMQLPLDFIRTKRSQYKCNNNVQNEIDILKFAIDNEMYKNKEFQLCEKPEKPEESVLGKHVLLIDETAYSGGTIKSSKEYLLAMGAKNVKVFVLSAIKNDSMYDYIGGKGVLAWPWSFDN